MLLNQLSKAADLSFLAVAALLKEANSPIALRDARYKRGLFGLLVAHERMALVVVFAFALLVRLIALGSVPNTATADELDFGRNAIAIVSGHGPGFFGFDWTPEPALSIYLMAASSKALGMSLFTERLVSALFTALSVFPFYALARRRVTIPAALLAATLFVASRWYLHFSRSGWNNAHIVLYMLLGAWALSLAIERHKKRYWIAFGGCEALLLYGYFSGRTVVLAFSLYLVLVTIGRARHDGGQWVSVVIGGLLATLVCVLLFIPELRTILQNFDAFNNRTKWVYIFNWPLPPGMTKIDLLRHQASLMIRSFFLMDGSLGAGRYKAPGQTWLDPVSSLLFLGGLVVSLFRRDLCLLWWCLLLVPLSLTQVLSTGTPDGARGLQAVAPMYLFAALAIDSLLRAFPRRLWRLELAFPAIAALIVANNINTYRAWIDTPDSQAVRQPAVLACDFDHWIQLTEHALQVTFAPPVVGAGAALYPASNLTVSASNLRLGPSLGSNGAPPSQRLIDVSVRLLNRTASPVTYRWDDFTLQASPSRIIATGQVDPRCIRNQLLGDTLAPGESAKGIVAFMMPLADRSFRLFYRPLFTSTQITVSIVGSPLVTALPSLPGDALKPN